MMIAWARAPFDRYVNYVHEADRLLHLCMQGLSHVSSMPALAEALEELHIDTEDEEVRSARVKKLEDTRQRAQFAKEEIDKGFPALHGHTVVTLWGALESLIVEMLVAWLINVPKSLENENFSKLKIPLAEYELLSQEDRMAFLISEYGRSLNADFKLGIGKFETLLNSINLSGKVKQNTRKDLLEMSQVRNVLVHRAGIADRRFKETCPWIRANIGEKHTVSRRDYVRYRKATHDYVLGLINRTRLRLGMRPYKAKKTLKSTKIIGN